MKRLLTTMMAMATFVLTIAPASAHSRLVSTVPVGGSTVATVLSEVALKFSEPIEAAFGGVQIFDAAGGRVSSGEPQIAGTTVKVALSPQLVGGDYSVAFRIISSDSHAVESRFAFTYKPTAQGQALPAAVAPAPPATGVESLPGVAFQADPGATQGDSFWSQYKYLAMGAAIFLLVGLMVFRPGSKEPATELPVPEGPKEFAPDEDDS